MSDTPNNNIDNIDDIIDITDTNNTDNTNSNNNINTENQDVNTESISLQEKPEKDEPEILNLNELDEAGKKLIDESIFKAHLLEQEELLRINDLTIFDDDELDDIDESEDFEEVLNSDGSISMVSKPIPKKFKIDALKNGKMEYMPVHIFAFAIPFMLMIIAFASIKIFPFGDKQIMIIDSWHQYYPFLQELQDKLTGMKSLLYSWNSGGGTNFLTLMSYYASTPLYLLSVLWPKDYLREFMMVITAVKIGCSGLFFSIYLRGIYNHDFIKKSKKSGNSEIAKSEKQKCSLNIGLTIIGFSLLYAVSAYAVGYYWCIMFLDGMALLPLIVLGLERLIDSGKFKLYIITLGIAVIASYYVAIFICIFIFLYFIVLYFMKTAKPTLFGFTMKGLKVLGASLIGIGLSAFILLPTFLWFGNTGNSGSTFNEAINTYNTLLDIITHTLPATTPAVRAGLPNIACGLIVIIFGALYFINSKIKLKDKLLVGGFLLFMLFSFNINILNFIWHGGHYPNEIPYRQAFVFSFVLVTAAFKSFVAFKGESINKKTVWTLGLCIFAYLIVAEQWYGKSSDKFDFNVFYISIALLIIYMAILLLYKNRKFSSNYLAAVLIFVMMFEGGMSAVKGAETSGTSPRDTYPPSKEIVRKTVSDIYAADENKFFRLEMVRWYSTNDPALYGYRGISQFSSEANGRFARTLEVLGLAASVGSNRYLYSSATPVFNMLMSLKYIMARDEEATHEMDSIVFDEFLHNEKSEPITDENGEPVIDEDGNAETFTSEPVTAYINKYWLPLGFMMSENVKDTDINQTNVFILQNDLMKKATGITGDVFKSITSQVTDNYNLDEYPGEYGVYSYRNQDKSQKATVTHYYTSDKAQEVYMYVKAGRGKNATVSVNGRTNTYEINRGITIDCGKVLAGQDIKVTFELEAGDSGSYYIFVAGFDEEIFKEGYDILSDSKLNITDFTDTNIKGDIHAYQDGLLFTSIPYDKGWHVKIDGKKQQINPKSEAELANAEVAPETASSKDIRQISKITDGFITVPLTAGDHKVEFYYVTEGLVPGIFLTILSVLLIIAWEFYNKYYKHFKFNLKKETKSEDEFQNVISKGVSDQ